VTLHRADGPVDVRHGLPLGDLPDQHLPVLGEGDDGRGRARPLCVGDDGRLAALEDGDDRVGGTEVDTDGTRHALSSMFHRRRLRDAVFYGRRLRDASA
jgi:hypothetical protein